MTWESLLLKIDRLAGGRQAGMRIAEADRTHRKTRRAFTWIWSLLGVEVLLGAGAVAVALVLAARVRLYRSRCGFERLSCSG